MDVAPQSPRLTRSCIYSTASNAGHNAQMWQYNNVLMKQSHLKENVVLPDPIFRKCVFWESSQRSVGGQCYPQCLGSIPEYYLGAALVIH